MTWERVEDYGTGTVTRRTGTARFKGTGRLARNFDLWEIDVDWTEGYTLTDDGSTSGEPCSAAGTGSGSAPLVGWIEFELVRPALDNLNVELDQAEGTTYPIQGDCYHPWGMSYVTARPFFSSPDVLLPDGRATTTLSGEDDEADGGISTEWTWQLTRKPDADCDGVPDETDGRAGRPCNFTKTHIEPVERTQRKLRIEGAVDPYYGVEDQMSVTLLRKRDGAFRRIATKHPVVGATLEWKTVFSRPDPGRCRVKARFPGSRVAEPSKAAKTFDC